VDELLAALDRHEAWLDASGQRAARRLARARDEIAALAFGLLARRLVVPDELAREVAEGRSDPVAAAERLLAAAGIETE
jgi:LAO/AO transport system kinase